MESFILQLNSLIPGFVSHMSGGLVIFARMMGFVRFAPVLNRKEMPTLMKVGLAFMLTIIFVMLLHPRELPSDADLLLTLLLVQ